MGINEEIQGLGGIDGGDGFEEDELEEDDDAQRKFNELFGQGDGEGVDIPPEPGMDADAYWRMIHYDLVPHERDDVTVVLPSIEPFMDIADELTQYYEVLVQTEEGLANAVRFGVERATTDLVVVMDADGEHPVRFVPKLLDRLGEGDMACGMRYAGAWGKGWKGALSKRGNTWACTKLDLPVSDCTSGFFVARREKLLQVPDSVWQGYGDYYIELLYCAQQMNWRIVPVFIEYDKRLAGKSHTKVFRCLLKYWRRVQDVDGRVYGSQRRRRQREPEYEEEEPVRRQERPLRPWRDKPERLEEDEDEERGRPLRRQRWVDRRGRGNDSPIVDADDDDDLDMEDDD